MILWLIRQPKHERWCHLMLQLAHRCICWKRHRCAPVGQRRRQNVWGTHWSPVCLSYVWVCQVNFFRRGFHWWAKSTISWKWQHRIHVSSVVEGTICSVPMERGVRRGSEWWECCKLPYSRGLCENAGCLVLAKLEEQMASGNDHSETKLGWHRRLRTQEMESLKYFWRHGNV